MTNKFKVGDRVNVTVEVRKVWPTGYRLNFKGAGIDVSFSDLHDLVDTTFRDQAANAELARQRKDLKKDGVL